MYYQNEKISKTDRIFDQESRDGYLRLDLNENPGGLPDEFIQKVLSDVTPEFVAKYPETLEFKETLAKFLGTDTSRICLVNGSSEGIRNIIEAFTSSSGKIVGVAPSYAMFEVYAQMYGRSFLPVHYTEGLEMPVNHILEKLTPDVELLILVNPNNPVGNIYSENDMKLILERAEANEITVLIDEAYFLFYPRTYIEYALEKKHIFITRTFSKLFSLAGCRLGYVVGWPEGIKLVQNLCTSRNINAFAVKFAKAVIETEGMVEELIELQRAGKQYLLDALESHGYEYHAREGNFVFIKPRTDAQQVMRKLKEKKRVLVKTYGGVGDLGNCLRVTTGEKKYMQQFVDALCELDQ